MVIDSFLFTNAGGRAYNEDSVGCLESDCSAVYVVADGLGGHQCGEVESRCVVDSFCALYDAQKEFYEDGADWLMRHVLQANHQILNLQEQKSVVMKSTVAALYIQGNQATWANTGDSRLYYIHNGSVYAVTEDHSVAYRKYRSGEITRSQIAFDEDQSSLLRVLGNKERFEPTIYPSVTIEPGDGFMLCSDGMWEYLLDGEIAIDMLKADSAKEWEHLLLLRAIERITPGNDNLSVITVMVH